MEMSSFTQNQKLKMMGETTQCAHVYMSVGKRVILLDMTRENAGSQHELVSFK